MTKRAIYFAQCLHGSEGGFSGFSSLEAPEISPPRQCTGRLPLEIKRMIDAEIATRLLAVGRIGDALGFIERADNKDSWVPREWQDTRLEVLEALDRKAEARTFRWSCFENTLVSEYLRDFLKRLPDFEDIEAEDRAMDHAAAQPSLLPALGFFLEWPSLDRTARLLIDRHDEINGDRYEFLLPAAETLSERFPLAATLALRAMINFTLSKARSKRYGYASQHLVDCATMDAKQVSGGTSHDDALRHHS